MAVFWGFLTSGRKLRYSTILHTPYPYSQTPTNDPLHSAYLSNILNPSLNPINQIRLLPIITHPLILQ
jgi:hypothetical protein